MAAPSLNDYEFQFKDAGVGVLLNGTSAVPFWDVQKVTGLFDFAPLEVKSLDLDGRHGSSFYAKFFAGRTIIFDGVLYASVSDFDTPLYALKNTMLPDNIDYSLYFKSPNQIQRYIMCKSVVAKCDADTGRRIGQGAFQLQFVAGDPRAFIDGSLVNWTTATNFTLTNNGNTTFAPIISITASSTTTASITVLDVTGSVSIAFSTAVTSGQAIVIDMENMTVKVAGVLRPVAITLAGGTSWPSVLGGVAETWKVTSNVGNGTATNKSAWL
jgi:phage-related protein